MKVLIIGAGNQGALADAQGSGNEHKVISFAHAFKERGAEITFLDKAIDKAHEAAKLWDCNYYNPILKCGPFDIVVVATPDDEHYSMLLSIAGFTDKPKLVICEKPLCMSIMSTELIVDTYKEEGIPLLINYTRRFIPEYRTLALNEEIEYGRCVFNRGVWHTGTHAIDTMLMFTEDFSIVDIVESDVTEFRVWDLYIKFKSGTVLEEKRIGDMPVPSVLDFGTRHLVANAYNFLDGLEPLLCTGDDALKGAEKIYLIKEKEVQ